MRSSEPQPSPARPSGLLYRWLVVREWIRIRPPRQWLLLIVALHLALGVVYSVAIPAWESYDEPSHYEYMEYILTYRSFPEVVRAPPELRLEDRELSQPPLYYLLAALATFWVDTSDNLDLARNPHVFGGWGGRNFAVHSGEDDFPYRSTFLAVHVARLLSVVISTLGVWVTYLLARSLFPGNHQISLGATAITAFSPQFLFMGSVMNNDILVTLFSSLFLLFCIRVIVLEARWRDFLAAGLFLGLALFSKYNSLALLPLALWALLATAFRRARNSRGLALVGLALLIVALALPIAGWLLPGSPLFGGPLRRFSPVIINFLKQISDPVGLLQSLHWDFLPHSTVTAFNSFWALFGWANLSADPWVYPALGLVTILSAVGVLASLRKQPPAIRVAVLILALDILLFATVNFYRSLRSGVNPPVGRYLLPTISAVSVLIAMGLNHWAGRGWRKNPTAFFGLGLLLLAAIAPFRYILPAYIRPPLLTLEEMREIPNRQEVNFGNQIRLLGYELDASQARPGGSVVVTLYLASTTEMTENYTMSLHLLAPDQEAYGRRDTFPGEGNYATSLWEPGTAIRDTYLVPISPDFPAPAYGQFKLAFFTYPDEEHLPVLGPQGETLGESIILGRFRVAGTAPVQVENPVSFALGDSFRLIGYRISGTTPPGQTLEVDLFWQSVKATDIDYQVFFHLIDAQGNLLAQADSPPRNGFYPTSLWAPGEIIADPHIISLPSDLPPGEYRLRVGMYRLDTLERIPVTDARHQRLPNDEIILEGIKIE